MNEADARFVAQAIGRAQLFRVLMGVGVAVGAGLLAWAAYQGLNGGSWGSTFALGILVLLNARSNLRQARYARILRGLTSG